MTSTAPRATWWRRTLHRWAGRLPTRIIWAERSEDDASAAPLFERGHLFTLRLPLLGEVTCYLHHYLRSDPDAGLHDHPWPWAVALPLAGGYREQRLTGLPLGQLGIVTRRRPPFLPYRLDGHDFHRVVVAAGRTSWSLFFVGRARAKPWGFLRPVALAAGPHPCDAVYYAAFSNEDGSHIEWWRTAPLGSALDRAAP